MKQNFTRITKRLISLLLLIGLQLQGWALETSAATANLDDNSNFFSQPFVWVAPIVVTIIILAGPFNYNKDFKIIRKKRIMEEQGMER